jgi:hypothetical protein
MVVPKIGGIVPSVVTSDDKLFSVHLLPALTLVGGDVDLEPYCSPISNQLFENSCVANASADAVELCNGVDGFPQVEISRNQIYYNGRSIMTVDGIHNLTSQDAGMSVKAAFQAMATFGICPESLWPYDPNLVNVRPDIKATWFALRNKLNSYYFINQVGPEMLTQIRNAISGKHPVCFGIPVTQAFENGVAAGQVIPPPQASDQILGQHCIMAMGSIGGNIKIRNSWGAGWSAGGYALLHQDWFNLGFANDPWVPTNGLVFNEG